MFYEPSFTEARHRAINAEAPAPRLVRKACECGTQVTKRQLEIHGKCETCALTVGLLPGDMDLLQHMLGVKQTYKAKWGYRNHYLCGVQDREAMERLVSAGLVERGDALLLSQYYHATRNGCRAAGLDRPAIARALGAVL